MSNCGSFYEEGVEKIYGVIVYVWEICSFFSFESSIHFRIFEIRLILKLQFTLVVHYWTCENSTFQIILKIWFNLIKFGSLNNKFIFLVFLCSYLSGTFGMILYQLLSFIVPFLRSKVPNASLAVNWWSIFKLPPKPSSSHFTSSSIHNHHQFASYLVLRLRKYNLWKLW